MNEVRTLRLVGILEGVSLLALVFIAMPLKHIFHMPMAVRVVGMIHGLLFLVFLVALFRASLEREWSLRLSLTIFIAAVLPFGFLFVDRRLKSELEPS
jgi:integral membrane protein